jgi:5-methylcytosine-specific restriction endonuclease McrA
VPVAEGGGECDLDNMRTLCLECHRKVTAELRARLGVKKVSLAEPLPDQGHAE